jgi:hypothetical protein
MRKEINMWITRKSQLSGKEHTLDLDVTEEQLQAFGRGGLVQDAFPLLTASQREFILTGITSEEWDETFKEEPELEDEAEDGFGSPF